MEPLDQQEECDSDNESDAKSVETEEERDGQELVPVVCKDTRGTLDLSKMCVTCHCNDCPNGNEMSPSGFERHCGAEMTRNWKSSLRHALEDIPMRVWLQNHGYIPAPKAKIPKEKKEKEAKIRVKKKARSDGPSIMDYFKKKVQGTEKEANRNAPGPQGSSRPAVRLSEAGDPVVIELDNDEEPGAVAQDSVQEEELEITCRGKRGAMCLKTWMVSCHCEECGEGGMLMSPNAFENHAGAGAQKKWKASCRTVDTGEGSSMILEKYFALRGIICPGSQKRDGSSSHKSKSSGSRWSAFHVLRLVRSLRSSEVASCKGHAETLLEHVRAHKPDTLMLESALSPPEESALSPPEALTMEVREEDVLKWGGFGKRSPRHPRNYSPPPPPPPALPPPAPPPKSTPPAPSIVPESSQPSPTGLALASALAAVIKSASISRAQAMSNGEIMPPLPNPVSPPSGNIVSSEWLHRLFQGLAHSSHSPALPPLILPPLILPAVTYDVLGPNPFETSDDNVELVITTALGAMVSSSIRDILEKFILSLDLKARSDVHSVWQLQRAQEQDPETGRSKLPSLPLPSSGLSERAVGRRRARILKEGALSMIVFGYDERLVWAKRIGSFIRSMRAVLGDRSLQTKWGGSVLDSVVGTFLTQNASDVLSSRAFLTLAGKFPSQRYKQGLLRSSGKGSDSDETPLSPDAPHELTPGEDIVDWEAVRSSSDPMHLVDAIRCRGMYFLLAGNIVKFLNKVHREGGKRPKINTISMADDNLPPSQPHPDPPSTAPSAPLDNTPLIATMDIEQGIAPPADVEAYPPPSANPTKIMSLEWLRSSDLTDEQCWSYLMSIEGLGRKSTACIMLLTLGRKEFPVDVHVARVCARIGWLPIVKGDPDPKDLEQYPEDPEVHKYLHKRLMAFDLHTLYELHYLMITLGKVFCQKKTPNCAACPLAPSCDYARFNGPKMQAASEEQKEQLRKKLAEKQRELEELEAEQVQERHRRQEEMKAGLVVAADPPKKGLRPAWGEGGAMRCVKPLPQWSSAQPRSSQSRTPASELRLSFLVSLSKDLQDTVTTESLFQSDFDKLAAGLRGLSSTIPEEVIVIDMEAEDPAPISDDRGEKRKASCSADALFTPSKVLKTSSRQGLPPSPLLTSLLETPNKEAILQRPSIASPITPFLDQWRAMSSLKKRPRTDSEDNSECDMEEANEMVDTIIARLDAEEDEALFSSKKSQQAAPAPLQEVACCHVDRVIKIMEEEEHSKASRGSNESSTTDLSLSAALAILTLPTNFALCPSSEALIKSKYRELCVVLHPDKNKHPKASDCFTALSMAADLVSSRSRLPLDGSIEFVPDADDPSFWVDEQGEINIPQAAKVLNEELGPPEDPRWSQALVLFNAHPSSVPLHITFKSRLHRFALPLPVDMVKRLVGPRSASWPSSCPSYDDQEGRVALGSPYLLMFVKQGDSSCVAMRPSEVEQALMAHNSREKSQEATPGLHAMLLLPAWVTLQGSFPLNATYFQTNEVMLDSSYISKPLLVIWDEVSKLALKPPPGDSESSPKVQLPWRSIYFGFSAASICSKMGFAEVANLFHRSSLCVRAFDWADGAHVLLPSFALP